MVFGNIQSDLEEPQPMDAAVSNEEEETGLLQPPTPEERAEKTSSLYTSSFLNKSRSLQSVRETVDESRANLATLPSSSQPDEETGEQHIIRDTANFLFGSDMAILGIKWDEEGINYKTETLIHQWSEHPVMSSIALAGLVGSVAFPVAGMISKSAKVGLLAKQGYTPGKSLLAHSQLASQVRHMATATDDIGQFKYFDKSFASKIPTMTDDQIEKIMPWEKVNAMLLGDHHVGKINRLTERVANGTATATERSKYFLHKQFGNTYFKFAETGMTRSYLDGLDNYYTQAGIGHFLEKAPGEEWGVPLYKFYTGKLSKAEIAAMPKDVRKFGEGYLETIKDLQRKMYDEGFISEETFKRFPYHLPALDKGTPGTGEFEDIATLLRASKGVPHRFAFPKLDSPTLLSRGKSISQAGDAADKLITDPFQLTLTGLVRDHQLRYAYSYLRDIALSVDTPTSKVRPFVKTSAEWANMSKSAKKQWISMEDLADIRTGGETPVEIVRRMISKRTGKEAGELPYMRADLFEQMFGEHGMFRQIDYTSNLMTMLTGFHKTAATSLNIGSHLQNVVGNLFGFLPQAGYNPFSAKHLADAKILSGGFIKVAKETTDRPIAEVMSAVNLRRIFGKADEITTDFGTKLRLSDEFGDEVVKQLIEESAFETVEGFNSMKRIFEGFERMEARGKEHGRPLAHAFSKIVSRVADSKAAKKPLHYASSAYLGEDMVPKMMYFLSLRRQGFSRDAAVLEVGRRLPQYKTVGKSIQGLRQWAFPWVTFPSETARIMKNNLQDYPLRMAAWLHMPNVVQSIASATGLAPNYETVQEAKTALPTWGSKASTVVLNPEAAQTGLPGFAGAAAGAMAGGVLGGGVGAVAGGLLGATAGVALGRVLGDDEDDLRGWVMDFLPQSALMASSSSPFAEPQNNMRQIIDLSPLEPFSVLRPLFDVAYGQGSFGEPIISDGPGQSIGKAALGLLGFLSPPVIQKYGMSLRSPNNQIMPTESILGFDVDAGTVGAVTGVAAGAGLGLMTGSAAIGAGAAAIGGLAGSQVNVNRIFTDMGLQEDARTGKPGNIVYDFLLNSFSGVSKSWKATPQQRLLNESIREGNFQEIRTMYTKNLRQASFSGNEGEVNESLQRVFNTFIMQYDDPAQAQLKFTEWANRQLDAIGTLPRLRGFSRDELEMKLMQASKFAAENRSRYARQQVLAIQEEILLRGYDSRTKKKEKTGIFR
jgi:hypothetical protein